MTGQVRLGVIVPSVNIVVEAWYPHVVPPGVSVHFARMLMPPGTSPERIIEMDGFDADLRDEIRHLAGVPATTATNSIFAACAALGMKRVTAISPYPDEVDAAEHRFFAEGGIETIAGANLGIGE